MTAVVKLPPLEADDKARQVTVCARFSAEAQLFPQPTDAAERRFVFQHGDGEQTKFVRFILGQGGHHLHLDIARPSYFGKRPPQLDGDEVEAANIISGFFGQRASLFLGGQFTVPYRDLGENSFVRVGQVTARTGDFGLDQKSARFEVTGESVREVAWDISADGMVDTSIQLQTEDMLDGEYLMRAYQAVVEAWKRWFSDPPPVSATDE